MARRKRQRDFGKRRWLRFGMRGLLCAMLAVVLVLASIERWLVRPYREQQRAIALLDDCGATYTQELLGPAWLHRIAPDRFFLRVVSVDLRGKRIGDPTVQRLGALTSLRRLDLQDTRITDAALEHVRRMSNLQQLNLAYTPVTDAGLEHLARLEHLQKLQLFGTTVSLSAAVAFFDRRFASDHRRAVLAAVEAVGGRARSGPSTVHDINLTRCYVGNAGLAQLAQFPELEELHLLGTLVSGSGPPELARLTNLRVLNLNRTQFTDAGLERLKGLNRLEKLQLGATLVTDTGLEQLSHLDRLEELELYYTRVTDTGLHQLLGLKELKRLDLVGTRVSDEGIRRVEVALPATRIVH